MAFIRIEENQNLFDAAIQEYGSIEGLFDLLTANSITDIGPINEENQVSVYDDLLIEGDLVQRDVVEYYISRQKKPATGITDAELDLLPCEHEGVGCMEIGFDFIVHDPSEVAREKCIDKDFSVQ